MSTVVHLSLAFNLISQLNQPFWPSLGCQISSRQKLGTEIFGVASVVATIAHHIVSQLKN